MYVYILKMCKQIKRETEDERKNNKRPDWPMKKVYPDLLKGNEN